MELKSLLAAAVLSAALIVPAATQPAYPTRPVRMIVPFAAGGAADVFARMIGQHLQNKLGQPFIIENIGGAGGAMGLGNISRAEPDGYTVGIGGTGGLAIAPSLFAGKLPYDVRNLAAVSQVSEVPNVLAINPNRVAARSIGDFIALLKANPGTVTYGSAGVGSSQHLAGELFQQMTGTKMIHVPYKGSSPMITDLIGGQIDVAFDNGPLVLSTAQSGGIVLLGVATLEPAPFDPKLPMIAETVHGYQANAWHVVVVPTGTPKPIVDTLATEIQAFMKRPETVRKMAELGSVAVSATPDVSAKRIADEIVLWRRVIEKAGVKPP
ncbi:MAG: tripartite tricarboxylate transporter substrate binding protein [Rhodoplanes sp.]|uniref:Bug family tripartite tricarboxylate transporter substrate binding protein n=1 Tax=Rhodoplanes sp. TaxID=1968906 RepID=UPI0017A31317|nr:tripartite tricarboxylate transporter substrate-binding protein [Rhodoplanes sp.]NVO14464.1 tripartite tricarboxylate transporter substrate binding protein [Rhodoplanes sp.]